MDVSSSLPWAAGEIMRAGRRMDSRGWVPATAGNISLRLPGQPDRMAITASGGHKGFIAPEGVMAVDLDGTPLSPGRPSAETLLHCQIYATFASAGAVLHGHSVPATVLSMLTGAVSIRFSGYELLKAFEGQDTHAASLDLPLVDNDQDMRRLAAAVAPLLAECRLGYLIRGHGVYVWGPDMDSALARLEGLEFLLACELERRKLIG
jgi:methylthioribulose-1-phosphate dehydratase